MNTSALTRRDFICQAALVSAGSLVAGNSYADVPPHPVRANPKGSGLAVCG